MGFSFWRRTPSRARCEVPSTRVNLIFWNKSSTADSGSLTEVFKVHKYFWPFLLSPTFNFFHFRFLEESLNQPNITKDGIVHEIIPDLPNQAKLFLLTKDGSKNVTLKMKHTIFVTFSLRQNVYDLLQIVNFGWTDLARELKNYTSAFLVFKDKDQY